MPVEILRVFDMPDFRTRGEIRGVRVVQFMVDGQGPMLVEIPHGEMTTEAVRAAVEREAELVRALLRGF